MSSQSASVGLTSERSHEREKNSKGYSTVSSQSASVWFDIRKKSWTRKKPRKGYSTVSSQSPSVWFDIN